MNDDIKAPRALLLFIRLLGDEVCPMQTVEKLIHRANTDAFSEFGGPNEFSEREHGLAKCLGMTGAEVRLIVERQMSDEMKRLAASEAEARQSELKTWVLFDSERRLRREAEDRAKWMMQALERMGEKPPTPGGD